MHHPHWLSRVSRLIGVFEFRICLIFVSHLSQSRLRVVSSPIGERIAVYAMSRHMKDVLKKSGLFLQNMGVATVRTNLVFAAPK